MIHRNSFNNPKKHSSNKSKLVKKSDPAYVDCLTEDKVIESQQWGCVSFLSPETILKEKNMFFFEQFIRQWDYNHSMQKYIQFLEFIAFKHKLPFEALTADLTDFVTEEKDRLVADHALEDEYKTFLDNNETDLQKRFDISHDFHTNTRGVKLRGNYATHEEACAKAKLLRESDPIHNVLVASVGKWLSWDPDAYKVGETDYLEEELNTLMNEKKKNEQFAKDEFDDRILNTKRKAMLENMEKSEKTGNELTQTITADGDLVGIKNMNTQEAFLTGGGEDVDVSVDAICEELFEGETVVSGKTDNGKSLLVSGPFVESKE